MKLLMYSAVGDGEGGVETVFKTMSNGLSDRGHNIIEVVHDPNIPFGRVDKENKSWRTNLYLPSNWKLFLRFKELYKCIISVVSIYRIVKKVEPDVINCHYFAEQSIYFSVLAKVLRCRFVLSCHGTDVENMSWTKKYTIPYIARQAESITCVSNDIANRLRKKSSFRMNIEVVHNGIDHSFWKFEDGNIYSNRKNKYAVSVGSLRCAKGHDVLLKAFEVMLEENPSATLELVGDGPKRAEYESAIVNTNLEENVKITGWCSQEEVKAKLSEASVFVFPSRHEGFGIALVEAMAMGCPVVATEVGGIPEVLGDAEGKLVPPESPYALANALHDALNDHEWQAKASAASVSRSKRFNWEDAIDKYEKCLCGVG